MEPGGMLEDEQSKGAPGRGEGEVLFVVKLALKVCEGNVNKFCSFITIQS